jgi:hypothetical protein
MSHQIHTYSELRQQIHDDLPIQHPEWLEPNGESLMCLMKLLDSLMQMGIQRVYSYSSSRLRRGTKPGSIPLRCNTSGGKLKLPAHILFRKDLSLMLWKPHGILNELLVNEIVAFIDVVEERASKPFNRFADLSALIIFNYSEGLLDVPSDVTVHTSNPAVELLYALYFHLA